ncbi:hypothetical protein A4H97_12085 [Niastella yeongjuensis]|uniref:Carbohydrate-binding protein SusD n=1 Tax=Niastella yeongjuensis TaxID=354355 RepID=A0A1V9EAD2_9BACT|nr:RagB/SusD family nutrient uptake outer membrane protein [Niastella yeongjuensis]OQP42885.1 hypothetical protein A4H97_12085 [Niastella yeongjuensis]SEO58136.1 SusD family protein [Niastella yeongjuensis]
MKQPLQYISMQSGKFIAGCLLILITASGCRKYLEVPLPIDRIAGNTVFDNDYSASAALNGVYGALYVNGIFDGGGSINYYSGLYVDELKNFSPSVNYLALYMNGVSSTIGNVSGFWTSMYKQMYTVNVAIEGLTPDNKGLTYRNQWLGEAYFLRGLLYFYLTNAFGDVPLVLGSDYLKNNALARSPQADVYKQILSDLQQAQTLLPVDFRDGNGVSTKDRGRPNQAAAAALLARVYLYLQDWKNAATQAGVSIGNAGTYQLVNPAQTFLVNSIENIWGIVPFQTTIAPYKVKDNGSFFLPKGKTPIAANVPVSLSDSLVSSFEPNDLRFTTWVGIDTVPAAGATPMGLYYYASKYKAGGTYTTAQETLVMLRLAEQYLIRAEARAQDNDLSGALADLNAVRTRAGLPNSTAVTQPEILGAIQRERRVELFTEGSHRFFDLRRTKSLDALMTKVSVQKGGAWEPFKQWWPIPLTDVQNNKNLLQTPGYQ